MGIKERQAEKIKAARDQLTQLQRYKAVCDYDQAQESGVKSLQLLGLSVKQDPSLMGLLLDINRSKGLYKVYPFAGHMGRNKVISEKETLQLEIMTELCGLTSILNEDLYLSLLLQIAKITAKRKENKYSALGYAGFSFIALRYLEEIGKAEVLVSKAQACLARYEAPLVQTIVTYILGHYVGVNFTSSDLWRQRLLQGVEDAQQVGETSYIGLNYEAWASLSFNDGMDLELLHNHLKDILLANKEEVTSRMAGSLQLLNQACEALLIGRPMSLSYNETYYRQDATYRMHYFTLATSLAMIMEDYEQVLKLTHEAKKDRNDMKYSYLAGRLYFNEGIAMTMEALNGPMKKSVASGRLKQLRRLFDYKVRQNPDLYGHLYKVISGCVCLLESAYDEGIVEFDQAIKRSVDKENYRDAAVTSLLLGHLYGQDHMDKSALYNYSLSADYYGDWGAKALRDQRLRKYRILVEVDEVANRWQGENLLIDEKVHMDALHLLEIINRQSAREGIETPLCQLMTERYDLDKWMVFSEVDDQIGLIFAGNRMVPWHTLEDNKNFSAGLVQRVWKHKLPVSINSDRNNDLLKYDAYLMDHGQGSLLGIPMVYDDHCYGVVYMERESDFDDHELKVIHLFLEQITYLQRSEKLKKVD